jgi:hypothetical protein
MDADPPDRLKDFVAVSDIFNFLSYQLVSQQESESGKQQQLGAIVERLESFMEESKLTETDQLYEEIKEEIRAINRKVIALLLFVVEYCLPWTLDL